MIIIREVEKADAGSLLELFRGIDSETEFMLYEPGERTTTVDEQQKIIESFNTDPNRMMWVAVDQDKGELAGFIVGIGGALSRNRHAMYCVMGVRQAFTGQGIGFQLLQHLEHCASAQGIHRLELTVMEQNQRAIGLYNKCGFQPEGVKRDALKVNEQYVNELYMSKLI